MIKKNSRRTQSGFTLTELAIVLGVMSVIVGAIWSASSSVSESRKESDAITELQTVSQGVLALMSGQTFPAAAVTAGNITGLMIIAQAIPSSYMDSVSTATADNPWDPGTDMGLKVYATSSNVFRVSFYNPSPSGCINLLLQGTSCQAGQPGCPTEIYTTGKTNPTALCQVNVTCNGTAVTPGIGWGVMTPTTAATLCGYNKTATTNSVEFDYSTQ